jgi:hypothetical protein
VRKLEEVAHKLIIIEEECPKIPRRGWAEMIRKAYEVNPLVCAKCGGEMRIIAFLTDYTVVDRIINHLKLGFVATKPPPPRIAYQELLMAAEAGSESFMTFSLLGRRGLGDFRRFWRLGWLCGYTLRP